MAACSSLAEARDIDLGVGECPPLTLYGHAASLRMLLDNLLDNAVRYISDGGLGLAIVREVVALHGGELTLGNAVGTCLKVTVRLPLR